MSNNEPLNPKQDLTRAVQALEIYRGAVRKELTDAVAKYTLNIEKFGFLANILCNHNANWSGGPLANSNIEATIYLDEAKRLLDKLSWSR